MNTEKCKLVHFGVDTHARIDGKLYLYFQNGGIVFEDELGDTYELHLKSQSLHEIEIDFKKFPFTPNDLMLQFKSGSVRRSVAFRVMLQIDGFAAAMTTTLLKQKLVAMLQLY